MQVAYYRMNAIRFLPLPLLITVFFFVLQVPPYSQKAIVQAVVTGPRGVRRMWGRQLSGQRLLLLSEESR